jgi:hypothetical protein
MDDVDSLKEITPKGIDEVNSIEVAKGRVPGGGEGDAEGVEAAEEGMGDTVSRVWRVPRFSDEVQKGMCI